MAIQLVRLVQIRVQDLLSDNAVNSVATAIEAYQGEIERGGLVSIDEGGTHVRMVPLRRS